MKTIKNAAKGIYKRVTDSEASMQVGFSGWTYCPKSEWKTNVRGPVKTNTKKEKEEKAVTEEKK